MSRYEKDLGSETIAVGFDEGMNTFFGQVLTNQADDDLRDLPAVLWIGGDFHEYLTLSAFTKKLAAGGYEIEKCVEIQIENDRTGSNAVNPENLTKYGWKIKR